jgi:uncharacterized protein YgiM (DUF1202 family)
MIRCTRNLFLILVAAFTLTGCMSLAPRIAGPQFTGETVAGAAIAGSALATEVMITPARVASATSTPAASPTHTVSPTSTVQATATPGATASVSPTQPAPTFTPAPTTTPTLPATATPESPAVLVESAANVRAGPGTAYPIIGAARVGQRLSVIGQACGWWQITFAGRTGWIWGALVTPNAAARRAPEVTSLPALPPPPTSPPPTATPSATLLPLRSPAPLPDLVVLGSETQYPVRARVVQGWGYEFVDLSAAYDIVIYRDVFGMLAHQIDDENVRRYRRQSRFARSGPLRITLIDAQPHPDSGCPGWGWAPDRDTFVDPYGMTQDPCRVEHSLFPQGDGAGTTLLIGWGYNAGTTLAIGAAGPRLADVSTTFLAETLPWPANLGPADRPDFTQPLYRPLGAAHREDGRWAWQDASAQIVPAGR